MAEHNDLLGGYHLLFLNSVVRTREGIKNTYVDDKYYKVHVYAVRLYFDEKNLHSFNHVMQVESEQLACY